METPDFVRTAGTQAPNLKVLAKAALPSRFGIFTVHSFTDEDGLPVEDIALTSGLGAPNEPTPTRIHSECLTGDALGSLRCDCRDQLEFSLQDIARRGRGVLVYLRQDGRGIGTARKVSAYALQDRGLDTLEANVHLGFKADLRTYGLAASILAALGISSVELYTNNPAKVSALEDHGIQVATRMPIVTAVRPENVAYLNTKRLKFGHFL